MTASGSPAVPAAPSRRTAGEPIRSHDQPHRSLLPGHPSDLIRLCALLVVADAGPIGGLDALNMLAPYARRLGEVPPTFPLLHQLEEDGYLAASAGLPRRYSVTAAGRREAGRLAAGSGPLLAQRLVPEAWLGMLSTVRH